MLTCHHILVKPIGGQLRLLLFPIVILCLTRGEVTASQAATLDEAVRQPRIIMFAPPATELDEFTDRDIAIQDFFAYWIEIQKRLQREIPGILVLETEAENIVLPDVTVSRSHTARGFGIIFYAPARGTRILDGVAIPDDCIDAARIYFLVPAPPTPRPTPASAGHRPASPAVAGIYIRKSSVLGYIDLKHDGTFFMMQADKRYGGDYRADENSITLIYRHYDPTGRPIKPKAAPIAVRFQVDGTTLIGSAADVWEKQQSGSRYRGPKQWTTAIPPN